MARRTVTRLVRAARESRSTVAAIDSVGGAGIASSDSAFFIWLADLVDVTVANVVRTGLVLRASVLRAGTDIADAGPARSAFRVDTAAGGGDTGAIAGLVARVASEAAFTSRCANCARIGRCRACGGGTHWACTGTVAVCCRRNDSVLATCLPAGGLLARVGAGRRRSIAETSAVSNTVTSAATVRKVSSRDRRACAERSRNVAGATRISEASSQQTPSTQESGEAHCSARLQDDP